MIERRHHTVKLNNHILLVRHDNPISFCNWAGEHMVIKRLRMKDTAIRGTALDNLQKDAIKDITSGSQVNSYFPYR